jgi:hypothetical protein
LYIFAQLFPNVCHDSLRKGVTSWQAVFARHCQEREKAGLARSLSGHRLVAGYLNMRHH